MEIKVLAKKFFSTIIFLGAIFSLQLLISTANDQLPILQQQASLIENHNIDPSALFYTDSNLALKAEKTVRNSIQ